MMWVICQAVGGRPVDARIVLSFFAVLFPMVAVWFVLLSWFFRRLRNRHTATYETLGSPSLFWNNSPRNNWLFLKFLCSSRWRELGDPAIAYAVRFMRIFLVIYLLFLVGMATVVLSVGIK
jgi:hypothetical protein